LALSKARPNNSYDYQKMLCLAAPAYVFLGCFEVAFELAFDLLPHLTLPDGEPEGQWQRGRLFWVTFFGEAKKVTGCRATPDQ